MAGNSRTLDRTFAALADPTRRAIIHRLAVGEVTVGELAHPLRVSLPTMSKHLTVLEGAGLVRRTRRGRHRICRLDARPLARASDWIDRHESMWSAQLANLKAFLEDSSTRSVRG